MIQNEILGKDSLNNIKDIIKDLKAKKILIFCGKNSFLKSGASEIFKDLLKNTTNEFFYKSFEYPDYEDLILSANIINNFKPDIIIAVGGGAVLDLAKLSNVFYNNKIEKENIKNADYKINKKFCKLIAVPTTAGSGAEATRHAVLYVDKNKYSIESSSILPDFIIIDPALIIGAPKNISSSSGIDALSQAIESLMSIKSNEKSCEYAIKSLEHSHKFLVQHINHPSFDTTHNMSKAALYSGKAISISKTTAPHAISYPFTSHFGVRHGQAVALTLSDCLNFNYKNIKLAKTSFDLKSRFNSVFKIFQVGSINDFSSKLNSIIKNIGLTTNIRDLNLNDKNVIDLILKNINSQRLANNPVEIDKTYIKSILTEKI